MIGHPGPGTVRFDDVVVTLPAGHIWLEGDRLTSCRSCGARMLFVIREATGKRVPLNPDGTSHFTTCPQAASWSRPSGKAPVTGADPDAGPTTGVSRVLGASAKDGAR